MLGFKPKAQPYEVVNSLATENWSVRDQRKHFVIERYSLSPHFPIHPFIHTIPFQDYDDDPTALNINKSQTICTQKSKDTQRIG